jgi:hypothetical protein
MIKPGTMVKYFPKEIKSAHENFMIGHTVMDEEFIKREKLRGALGGWESYAETYDLEPGTYIKLVGKGNGIMMSDTPMEIRTNREFIEEAHGDVLIAGLGLGVVLLSIQKGKDVETITVVEQSRELVEFIVPHLPLTHKVEIRFGNIFEWLPRDGEKFDTIYFDIWDEISGDNYPQTKELHKRFRKYLNKDSNLHWWMDSWRREDFKRKYFESKKYHDDMARFDRMRISSVETLEKDFDKKE